MTLKLKYELEGLKMINYDLMTKTNLEFSHDRVPASKISFVIPRYDLIVR